MKAELLQCSFWVRLYVLAISTDSIHSALWRMDKFNGSHSIVENTETGPNAEYINSKYSKAATVEHFESKSELRGSDNQDEGTILFSRHGSTKLSSSSNHAHYCEEYHSEDCLVRSISGKSIPQRWGEQGSFFTESWTAAWPMLSVSGCGCNSVTVAAEGFHSPLVNPSQRRSFCIDLIVSQDDSATCHSVLKTHVIIVWSLIVPSLHDQVHICDTSIACGTTCQYVQWLVIFFRQLHMLLCIFFPLIKSYGKFWGRTEGQGFTRAQSCRISITYNFMFLRNNCTEHDSVFAFAVEML